MPKDSSIFAAPADEVASRRELFNKMSDTLLSCNLRRYTASVLDTFDLLADEFDGLLLLGPEVNGTGI